MNDRTDAPPAVAGEEPLFDITKQVWTFDPDDMEIMVDGMWALCTINDGDSLPCVDDDDVERVNAEAVACGHAIAALPELASACEELLSCLMDGALLGGLAVPISREQAAKIAAMKALLKVGVPFGCAREMEPRHGRR